MKLSTASFAYGVIVRPNTARGPQGSQGSTAGSHDVTLLTTSSLGCDAHEDGTWTCICSGPRGLGFDMPASDTPPCEQT